jgi:CRISPR-associated protein Cmr5
MTPKRIETKTLDQERAAYAWDCIQAIVKLQQSGNEKDQKAAREFGIQLKKLPTRILAAGLGQALAFLHAKGYAPKLVENLDNWLARRRAPDGAEASLLVRIIKGDADFQRYATAEVLAYLLWLVRFADAHDLTKNAQE